MDQNTQEATRGHMTVLFAVPTSKASLCHRSFLGGPDRDRVPQQGRTRPQDLPQQAGHRLRPIRTHCQSHLRPRTPRPERTSVYASTDVRCLGSAMSLVERFRYLAALLRLSDWLFSITRCRKEDCHLVAYLVNVECNDACRRRRRGSRWYTSFHDASKSC